MKKSIISIFIIFALFAIIMPPVSNGGELDAWEFRFFGINTHDFEDRSPLKVIGGAFISIVAHEAGHLLAAEITGIGAEGMSMKDGFLVAAANEEGWMKASNDQRSIFSAAGFIVQSIGSLALTAIPESRHSDWTVGWNTCTTIVGLQYALVGGGSDTYSDTVLMDNNGWPGKEFAWATTLTGSVTTYISLNKHKESN